MARGNMRAQRQALRKFVVKTVKSMKTRTYHKVRIMAASAPAATDTYITLLTSKDDPNYDLATDGTNVAECEVGSHIRAVQFKIIAAAAGSGDVAEFMMFKDPDAAYLTNFAPGAIYSADVDTIRRGVREHTIWYELYVSTTGSDTFKGRPRLSAIGRIKIMRENDNLRLLISVPAGSAFTYWIVGRIITAK